MTPGALPASAPPALLARYGAQAEPFLRQFLDAKGARLAELPVDLGPAHALLRDYVLRGGKRLRGALVLLGHEAAGGDSATVLPASVGVELLHAYLLIHDDYMDRDELRRGGPTLHRSLSQRFEEHAGGSIALLLGSVCQAWAYELVLAAPVAPDRALAAARMLTDAVEEVTLGQALDIAAPAGPELSAAGVLEVQRRKTGGYTFQLPLQLGAVLGGGSQGLLDALERVARPLGQAFQIADDLLGTFGAPEVTGKPNASDLREGKRTLLVTRALESGSPADTRLLREGLGRRGLTDAEAEDLRQALIRTGAPAAARAEAERLRAESLAALADPLIPDEVRAALTDVATYAVRRGV